jgi:hypothetical protein
MCILLILRRGLTEKWKIGKKELNGISKTIKHKWKFTRSVNSRLNTAEEKNQ